MIKHIWSVLCQRAVIDTQTNNISLFDVFEQLTVNIAPLDKKVPIDTQQINIPVQYELVNFWSRDTKNEEKFDVRIALLDPTGKIINSIDKQVVIPEGKARMREINKIQNIALRGSGTYSFTVSIRQANTKDYKQVSELPLEVLVGKMSTNAPSLA